MPPHPIKKATSQTYALRKTLQKAVRNELQRTGTPSYLAKLSATDLYEAFIMRAKDEKGNLAAGYGKTGGELGGYFDFSPLSFGIKGLIDFEAEVEIKGATKWGELLIVILHHSVPRTLASPGKKLWDTESPLSFMQLRGVDLSYAGAIKGKFEAGLRTLKEGFEEGTKVDSATVTELPLMLAVVGEAELSGNKDWLFARATGSNFYPGFSDSGLKAEFQRTLRDDENILKQELRKWIDRFNRNIVALNNAGQSSPLPGQSQSLMGEVHARIEAKRKRETQENLKKKAAVVIRKGAAVVRKSVLASLPVLNTAVRAVGDAITQVQADRLDRDTLGNALKKIQKNIPEEDAIRAFYDSLQASAAQSRKALDEERSMLTKAMAGIKAQCEIFQGRLKEMERAAPPPSIPSREVLLGRLLCFLKMGSHQAKGFVGMSAEVPFAVKAGGKLAGSYKCSAYRYQTHNENTKKRRLIYTQDTKVIYRQAGVTGDFNVFGTKVTEKEKFRCNGLSYTSAGAYWLYPRSAPASQAPPKKIFARRGSGLSFGCSIWRADLVGCIEELRKAPSPQAGNFDNMLKTIAGRLCISRSALEAFFKEVDPKQLETDLGGVSSAFVESSIPFDPSVKLQIQGKTKTLQLQSKDAQPKQTNVDVFRLASLWNKGVHAEIGSLIEQLNAKPRDTKDQVTLRIRVRAGDEQNSSCRFKLGLKLGLGAGIELADVREGRFQGVFTIRIKVYPDTPLTTPDEDVPPVALFLQ